MNIGYHFRRGRMEHLMIPKRRRDEVRQGSIERYIILDEGEFCNFTLRSFKKVQRQDFLWNVCLIVLFKGTKSVFKTFIAQIEKAIAHLSVWLRKLEVVIKTPLTYNKVNCSHSHLLIPKILTTLTDCSFCSNYHIDTF